VSSELRAESIVVNGTKISYRHNLTGERDVALLLHGLGGDHRGLLQVAQALPDVDVVIPDVPGYGDSAPLTVPHTLANYAAAVEALRVALDLGPVHLIGHSLGASIALLHAATYSTAAEPATHTAADSPALPSPAAYPIGSPPAAVEPAAARSAASQPDASHSAAAHSAASHPTAAEPAAAHSAVPLPTAAEPAAAHSAASHRAAAELPAAHSAVPLPTAAGLAAAHSAASHRAAADSAAHSPSAHSIASHPVAAHSAAAESAAVQPAALRPATQPSAVPPALRSLTLLNPVSTANNVTANLGKLYYRVAAALPARAARFWLASKPAVYIADAMIIVSKDKAIRRRILDEDYENYARASVPAMIESFLSYYDTDFEQRAAHVAVDTLLLTGDADRIAPVASVTALAAAIPSATLRVLPGGGHLLPMETPADVAEPLTAFLRDRLSRTVTDPTESV
jgi:pimeloyl-ACP methyl ester carboxylesterase